KYLDNVIIVIPGRVLVPPGSVVVPPGSVLVPPGSVVVPTGSVLVTPGSVITTGSILISEDVVNRILQVVLDLQHFKSHLFNFAATILQSSSAIHHISNIDNFNMYIKSYSFSLFSSLPGVLTPVRGESLKFF
ncbi:hypothetical protein Tco_0293393, partial [Tanacetum coccineum]